MATDSTFSEEIEQFSGTQPEWAHIKSLEDLAGLNTEQLWTLYCQAKVPSLDDLDGRLVGRMLTVPGLENPAVARNLRGFAASGMFPWQGKTFESRGDGTGKGVNRVLGDRKNWFRFDTFIGTSRAGDFDAVHLNYDNPANPAAIRTIKDEIREVAPGIWLGLGYLRLPKGKYHLALFFALTNQESIQESTEAAEARFGHQAPNKALMAAVALPMLATAWYLLKKNKR